MKLLNLFYLFNAKIHQKVLHTSILNFAPFLKLHHVVVVWDSKEMYAVDFSPINQPHPLTLLKLILGKNVPAETRIRKLNTFTDKIEIYDTQTSELLTNKTFEKIQNKKLKKMIKKMRSWKTMNLYNQNCQHFSSFAKKLDPSSLSRQ